MVVEETKDLDHIRIRNRIQQDEHQTPAAHFAIWKNRNLQKSWSLSLSLVLDLPLAENQESFKGSKGGWNRLDLSFEENYEITTWLRGPSITMSDQIMGLEERRKPEIQIIMY